MGHEGGQNLHWALAKLHPIEYFMWNERLPISDPLSPKEGIPRVNRDADRAQSSGDTALSPWCLLPTQVLKCVCVTRSQEGGDNTAQHLHPCHKGNLSTSLSCDL